MSDIRSKPSTDNYRNWCDSTFGHRPLPKGAVVKRYSLDDLKKERAVKGKKKQSNKKKKK